ncbi:hypothetical protein [Pseudomonas zeae]|uniref:hypothetical protein n=1 Tax=Pseudomonas zeae TaxID=2745510 RepID=UPI0039E1F59C
MNAPDSACGGQRAASDPLREVACEAFATRGQWNNEYLELVIPRLPRLPIWPEGWGLVIVNGKTTDYYAGNFDRKAIHYADIDFDNNVVLRRVDNNHYNVLFRGEEREMPEDSDCLFRAVITAWHGGRAGDKLSEGGWISELREHVANYTFEHWGYAGAVCLAGCLS